MDQRPHSFVTVIQRNFAEQFRGGDRSSNRYPAGDNEADHEGVECARQPPANGLEKGPAVRLLAPRHARDGAFPLTTSRHGHSAVCTGMVIKSHELSTNTCFPFVAVRAMTIENANRQYLVRFSSSLRSLRIRPA